MSLVDSALEKRDGRLAMHQRC